MTGDSWDDLIQRLRAEESAAIQSDSGASVGSVRLVREKVERASELVAAGERGSALHVLTEAARQVSDGWSYTSVLGRDVLAFKQALERSR